MWFGESEANVRDVFDHVYIHTTHAYIYMRLISCTDMYKVSVTFKVSKVWML